jgi:hypothetical protein
MAGRAQMNFNRSPPGSLTRRYWTMAKSTPAPGPIPTLGSTSEVEAATKAPAMIAGRDTADVDASTVWPAPPTP